MNSTTLPKHIAIVMDGNGRYAEEQGKPRFYGHEMGAEIAREIIEACHERNIEVLSLFAFSTENWARPAVEIEFIQQLMLTVLNEDALKLKKNNIQLRMIGNISRFHPELQKVMREAENMTRHNTGMKLLIAANYGGQWDIVQATQRICEEVKQGKLSINEINSETIEKFLSTYDLPAPDLLIRTSGEQRISNFFIWQLAYTELYFSQKRWPEFSKYDLDEAITFYLQRERRFGNVCVEIK